MIIKGLPPERCGLSAGAFGRLVEHCPKCLQNLAVNEPSPVNVIRRKLGETIVLVTVNMKKADRSADGHVFWHVDVRIFFETGG